VAELKLEHVETFTGMLSGESYLDGDMIVDAINRRVSFNVVHLATMFKADVFVPGRDSWTREELKRARLEQFDLPEEGVTIRFASPEDTLLHKLVWYKLGNEISERQWRDVLGIMKVQGDTETGQSTDATATGSAPRIPIGAPRPWREQRNPARAACLGSSSPTQGNSRPRDA
jgi:hypothetical protein